MRSAVVAEKSPLTTRTPLVEEVAGALANLVHEVEMDACRHSIEAGLGASEWEAFVPERVWNALSLAGSALTSVKEAE